MDSSTKSIFTKLKNEDKHFDEAIMKITKRDDVSSEEYSYILSFLKR